MNKREIINYNQACIRTKDIIDEDIKDGKTNISGMSGGPLCSGCNPWLMKISNEEREIYVQYLRDGNETQFEYKEMLIKKYE